MQLVCYLSTCGLFPLAEKQASNSTTTFFATFANHLSLTFRVKECENLGWDKLELKGFETKSAKALPTWYTWRERQNDENRNRKKSIIKVVEVNEHLLRDCLWKTRNFVCNFRITERTLTISRNCMAKKRKEININLFFRIYSIIHKRDVPGFQ